MVSIWDGHRKGAMSWLTGAVFLVPVRVSRAEQSVHRQHRTRRPMRATGRESDRVREPRTHPQKQLVELDVVSDEDLPVEDGRGEGEELVRHLRARSGRTRRAERKHGDQHVVRELASVWEGRGEVVGGMADGRRADEQGSRRAGVEAHPTGRPVHRLRTRTAHRQLLSD